MDRTKRCLERKRALTSRGVSRLGGWIWVALLLTIPRLCAEEPGGFAPDEAAKRMTVPPGFHVEVFAAEPMVRQPLSASFDERGRLWVIEYLQYPNPAGLKPVTVDKYLRTEYDRVPEPPPHGPRGADRIKILEDTDGDGRADKATVFVDGLNLASGLAVGHGGVFVGQAPYLLFYPDKNRDDRPDGDPEVLLSGFGLQDAHATVNSLTWGPDGWLYGAQGSTVTAKIRDYEFQQGIWRYQPRTRQFELFAEGGGNTWGLDFDSTGNAFGSSNGAYITFHMIQGGYYLKGFAKHGPLHNARAYGYFGPIAYHGAKQGGHVTPGGIIYKGDALPTAFRGAFIGGNLLSNAVYWHNLTRDGSTFSGRHGGTLIDARDRWFRPIDLLVGPDAAVYVVDWYDKRAAHLDPRDTWDRTNGRIYRVVYGPRRTLPPFDLAQRSSAELVAFRTSSNDWFAAEARRLLAERRDTAVVPALKEMLKSVSDETIALRDLWALYVSGGLDDGTALDLLGHPVAGVRRWTIRMLGDEVRINSALRAKLVALAATEPDAMVRSQLASSCQRWNAADALPILSRLIRRDEDQRDPHIPTVIWWAFERQIRRDKMAVVELLCSPEIQRASLMRHDVLERATRALASGDSDADFEACARLLGAAPGDEQRAAILAGMEKGLEGRRLERVPASLAEPLLNLWSQCKPEPPVVLVRLAARLGSPVAVEAALERMADPRAREPDRIAVIELLGELGRAEDLPALVKQLNTPPSQAIALAAIAALGHFRDPAVATALLARYRVASPVVRDRILGLICTRPTWTSALLDSIAGGEIAAKDLTNSHVQLIAQSHDPALVRRLESLWGKLPKAGSPEKIQRIAEVRGLLPEGDKGSAARGKPIFKENCAVCHKLFGDGETIGPDLTGADRGNLDFLLNSLVDPGALIRKEYQAQTVALRDGRVLNGLIVEENDRSLTLLDSNRQKTVVPRESVEEVKPSDNSLMPEGLLDKLTEPQIRDLFRYLQGNGSQ
jgi:putative membrane-bound dehydrogenase-like protein